MKNEGLENEIITAKKRFENELKTRMQLNTQHKSIVLECEQVKKALEAERAIRKQNELKSII